MSISIELPQGLTPSCFADICSRYAKSIKDVKKDLRKGIRTMIALINGTREQNATGLETCDDESCSNLRLFRIFSRAIEFAHDKDTLPQALVEILSEGQSILSKFAISILHKEFPGVFKQLPNWCLNPSDKEAFFCLTGLGHIKLVAPFAVSAYCDVLRTQSPIQFIVSLDKELVEAWDLQGFITALEERDDFVSEEIAFCNFENILDIVMQPEVTQISPETYQQLENFYDGLEDESDCSGRDHKALKPLIKSLKPAIKQC
jgi:hypothetical protein